MSIHGLWIPTQDGERECCCCGIHLGGVTLPCGDHYCQICEGRGHHEPHEEAECAHGEASPVFKRMEHDCLACGERHADWERCARMLREYIAANKADPLDEYVIRARAVERAEEMTK